MSVLHPAMLSEPVSSIDHIRGSEEAAVTLVAYTDFECPLSGHLNRVLCEAQRRLGDDLRIVVRHFPQVMIHRHSLWAAEVAEAAARQDRFWEMHDYLFRAQMALDIRTVLNEAKRMGIDDIKLIHDFARDIPRQRVGRDMQSARESAVREAPALFVNGHRYQGAFSKIDSFIGDLQATREIDLTLAKVSLAAV